jgi:hypothetical protein
VGVDESWHGQPVTASISPVEVLTDEQHGAAFADAAVDGARSSVIGAFLLWPPSTCHGSNQRISRANF